MTQPDSSKDFVLGFRDLIRAWGLGFSDLGFRDLGSRDLGFRILAQGLGSPTPQTLGSHNSRMMSDNKSKNGNRQQSYANSLFP